MNQFILGKKKLSFLSINFTQSYAYKHLARERWGTKS